MNRAYWWCVAMLLLTLTGCNTDDQGGCWRPSSGNGAGGAPVTTPVPIGGSPGESPDSAPQGAGGAEPVDCGPSDPVSCICTGSLYCAWTADAKQGYPQKPDQWCTYDKAESFPVTCGVLKAAMLGACREKAVKAQATLGTPYADPSGWACSTVFMKCTEK